MNENRHTFYINNEDFVENDFKILGLLLKEKKQKFRPNFHVIVWFGSSIICEVSPPLTYSESGSCRRRAMEIAEMIFVSVETPGQANLTFSSILPQTTTISV